MRGGTKKSVHGCQRKSNGKDGTKHGILECIELFFLNKKILFRGAYHEGGMEAVEGSSVPGSPSMLAK